jgi:hypothetical protein
MTTEGRLVWHCGQSRCHVMRGLDPRIHHARERVFNNIN